MLQASGARDCNDVFMSKDPCKQDLEGSYTVIVSQGLDHFICDEVMLQPSSLCKRAVGDRCNAIRSVQRL